MTWEDFKLDSPELAALGEERFEGIGLALLGTLSKNGWPRISPVEPLFAHGQLYLGMMYGSRKARDLLRDPRCTVHSATSKRDGSEGDFKVYGRVTEVHDLDERRRYCDSLYQKIGWKPEELELHLFAMDIERVAFVEFKDEQMTHQVWNAA